MGLLARLLPLHQRQDFASLHHLFKVNLLVACFLLRYFTTPLIALMPMIKIQAVTVAALLASQVIATKHNQVLLEDQLGVLLNARIRYLLVVAFWTLKSTLIIALIFIDY